MALTSVPPRVRAAPRLSYKAIGDQKCRRQLRGCPRLLQRLLLKIAQARHLYVLNVFARSGLVTRFHRGQSLRVHRGKKWRVVTPTRWHVGATWGSLGRSRRVAAFKAKAANKRRKKTSKGAEVLGEMRILQFRALQLGQKRKTSTRLAVDLESQLRSVAP